MQTAKKPRILFISRAYPPVTGGIENQNYEVSLWLSKITDVKIVANKKGRKFLPLFAPYALFYTIFNIRKYDVILLGDGVLSFISWFTKIFSSKPILAVIHGLDVNYDSASLGVWYEKILIFLYQKLWVKLFLPSLDKFIAVGNETVKVLRLKNIPSKKIVFIPNGIDQNKFYKLTDRTELEKILDLDLSGKKILLTSGRLARRKGVAWFCRNVMPKLPENILYIVAGNGPDKNNIANAIVENNLSQRVIMLGFVTDKVRNNLFNTCDLFIQPNIKITGDMEGFGMSVIEAASCQIPVIASSLEGLKDAIKDGKNGFLVGTEDAQGYIEKITSLLANDAYRREFGKEARQYIIENYSWGKISQRYLEEIEKTLC
ncbi:MAG: glycosyltransferase family 4 protein [Candidatus Moranbacteria bacterium]|nr:glycosyltransferase family 4 protein [Candidatus Moranbacteria bacterium]